MLSPCIPYPHDPQEPASAERALVASVWGSIQQIICTDNSEVEAMIRQMSASLPPMDTITSHDLASLAQLHLKSSEDLTATAKILAPAVFRNGLSRPDISALRDDESGILGMLSNIIELQLFHVLRAQAITAAMRARVAAGQQQQAQQLGAAGGETGPVTHPVLLAAGAASSNNGNDCQAHMGYLD